ncbi:MAG: hypothetical protein KatS3mg068_1375 [Candidatus Sericytochromatia bacterium]|nr:MAG: hypothetical protein KatS3mg068_1375 [Candidatus Sericytochromatia bacterium]
MEALEIFTNKLKDWQREGYYVLLNNFYNMPDKNIGFVVSYDNDNSKFIFKLYVNRELNEKHYKDEEVNKLIEEIDSLIK